ncbi:MAG: ATP-binding protein [Oceanospirillaceae bacterium]|nr:ATP-binding protein [Oceanospirillaceae bacterium]
MKLTRLTLTNYRCFDELDIHFDDKLTVLIAPNGGGKTSVLDAISVVISSFVGSFDMGKAHGFAPTDARYAAVTEGDPTAEQQYPVDVCASFAEPAMENQHRQLSGPKNKTTVKDVAELIEHGKQLMDEIRQQDAALPVIAYYGTGRLWKQHKLMERQKITSASRSMGYEDCLSSSSNYLQMQIWMKSATFASLQEMQMPDTYPGQPVTRQLRAVKKAVDDVLKHTDWYNFHYSISHDELAMQHKDRGILPVGMLSDGVRAMVSMVADLAWRCVKLNSARAEQAPVSTPGIVLIDEVDMHLHPAWQQQVVGSLISVFRQVQFILTTHSPQVLTTVPNQCIRVLDTIKKNDQTLFVALQPDKQSRGVASNDLLAKLQHTNPTPDVPEAKWVSAYKALIQQNAHTTPKGYDLKKKILDHFGDQHREWRECERLIRLQAMKAKLPPSNH